MYTLTSENESALEIDVERAAELHESQPYSPRDYIRFFDLGQLDTSYRDLCVKYDDYRDIKSEYSMLRYLYALACEDGSAAPHVSRPVHCFLSPRHPWGYLVMDRIQVQKVSELQELHRTTAEAVKWLHSKGPPPGTCFGPTGNYARHIIFKNDEAPMIFTSVAAVERYLNTAVHILSHELNPLTDISIANEKMILTQCDMNASNFGVALDGRPVIFDAITIQAMPLSLAYFTLFQSNPFSVAVSRLLFNVERAALLNLPNMRSLAKVGNYLTMIADDTLGLDENGIEKLDYQSD